MFVDLARACLISHTVECLVEVWLDGGGCCRLPYVASMLYVLIDGYKCDDGNIVVERSPCVGEERWREGLDGVEHVVLGAG